MYTDNQVPEWEKMNKTAENGEIQNPYYNAGFENLADENEEEEQQADEQQTAEQQNTEYGQEQDDQIGYTAEAGKLEDEDEKTSDNTVVGRIVGAAYDAGTAPDLESLGDYTKATYGSEILEETQTAGKEISQTEIVKDANTNEDDAEASHIEHRGSQPKEVAVAAATEALNVKSLAEKYDGDAGIRGKFEEASQKAQALIDAIDNAITLNADNIQEANVARQLKEQAQNTIDEARRKVEEFDSLSEEDKELAQEAKEETADGTNDDYQAKLEELKKEKEEQEKRVEQEQKDNPETQMAA